MSAPLAGAPTLPTDGLLVWLDASDRATLTVENDVVAQWHNKAPGATSAFASEGRGRPRYLTRADGRCRPVVWFDGRDDALRRFMRENEHPKDDSERDVLKRTVGGYSMQRPNDRMREGDWPLSTLDITSGAVHALAECWRHRTTTDGSTYRVNLLFDFQDEQLTIRSGLPSSGRIEFAARSPLSLLVRIPAWAKRDAMAVTVNGRPRELARRNGYASVSLRAGDAGAVSFSVPCRVERETVDGIEYTATWVGNQIVKILPRGTVSPLPF